MSETRHRVAPRRGESGVVLLLVVFMAAAMLIAALATLPRILMQGRRQKEAELAWRGQQYVRAIRLYYRKYGHFPRTVEDFSTNPGNIHFLRKEYKDPINDTDGKWRYIYVGPGGQLIGSLTRQMPLGLIPLQVGGGGGLGSQPGTGQSSFFGSGPLGTSPGAAGQPGTGQPGASSAATAASGTPQTGTTGAASAQPGAAQPGSASAASGQPSVPQPGEPTTTDASAVNPDDTTGAPLPPAPVAPKQAIQGASTTDSTVFGGQLVGVASKVDSKSIRFYKGYGKYKEWEFIWDPAEEAAGAGGLVPQAPGGLLPGATQPPGTQPIFTPPVVTTPPNPNNPPQQ